MGRKRQSKAEPSRKDPSISSRMSMAMLRLKGDPKFVLNAFAIPKGVKVAIISEDGRVIEELWRRHMVSFEQLDEVEVRQAGHLPEKQKPSIDQGAFAPDARSLAILQGIRIAQANLREAGGAYDLEQVRLLMHGISRQAVDKRVSEGSLIAVPGPSNRRSYPTVQFKRDGTIVDGLKAVSKALPTTNPWTILDYLVQPDNRLNGERPIDLLKRGEIDLVVEAARRVGEQGA